MSSTGFLASPEPTAQGQLLFDEDVRDVGYVMNTTRLWAYQPATVTALFDLMGQAISGSGITFRQRGILVTACAAAFGDSYCALAWGSKLAGAADAQIAGAVLRGDDEGLSDTERAMAQWARKVVRDPNRTVAADVQPLRDAGLSDAVIFAITVFVALRMAFSTVNDALGAQPDAAFGSSPAPVLDAVTFGRPIDGLGTVAS